MQLAQSSNSKVVIIGAGQNSMPIILGNLDSTIAVAARCVRHKRSHGPKGENDGGNSDDALGAAPG